MQLVRPVEIAAHNPQWPGVFQAESQRVLAALGKVTPVGTILGVEHIGSTSVPGLGAKPVVDFMIGVAKGYDLKTFPVATLTHMSYVQRHFVTSATRTTNTPAPRLLFSKYLSPSINLHVFEHEGVYWNGLLAIRNYLRAHTNVAQMYEHIKRLFAARYGDNLLSYAKAKRPFLNSVQGVAARKSGAVNAAAGSKSNVALTRGMKVPSQAKSTSPINVTGGVQRQTQEINNAALNSHIFSSGPVGDLRPTGGLGSGPVGKGAGTDGGSGGTGGTGSGTGGAGSGTGNTGGGTGSTGSGTSGPTTPTVDPVTGMILNVWYERVNVPGDDNSVNPVLIVSPDQDPLNSTTQGIFYMWDGQVMNVVGRGPDGAVSPYDTNPSGLLPVTLDGGNSVAPPGEPVTMHYEGTNPGQSSWTEVYYPPNYPNPDIPEGAVYILNDNGSYVVRYNDDGSQYSDEYTPWGPPSQGGDFGTDDTPYDGGR